MPEGGFKFEWPKGLKPRHVHHLVARWKREVTTATIKNRMSHIRWWARQVGKAEMIPSNGALGIARRVRATNEDRGRDLDEEKLAKIRDPYVAMSLRLQAAFGLRREEAIKFTPRYAVLSDRIRLKASWTKGGRPREIPIRHAWQRQVLRDATSLAKGGAMIKPGRNYIQQRKAYENGCADVGFDKMHGLRHRWAQDRYEEITGRPCSACGGPRRSELQGPDAETDRKARLQIARELGHGRPSITETYCGP